MHEPARITPKTGQIWRNKISSKNYRVLFTSDWGTAEPYVTIGRIVKRLFDEPEEVQVEGQLFLMDFELVQEPEEEYLHKNPENLGTSSEPSQKVGTCQKTPVYESLQQEDCKKRGFVRPSHETPEHYRLDPEPIAVIKAWDLGFCLGNVIKYLARAGHKAGESRDKDLHIHAYEKETGKTLCITGVRASEGGLRAYHADRQGCVFRNPKGEVYKFQPLSPVSDEFMDWYIEKRQIKLAAVYNEPYNFKRTGCKGCPYNVHIAQELDTMEHLMPNERTQCEIIWKPVYDEYRRIGYRKMRKEHKE